VGLGAPTGDCFGVRLSEQGTAEEYKGTGRFTERKRWPPTTQRGNFVVALHKPIKMHLSSKEERWVQGRLEERCSSGG